MGKNLQKLIVLVGPTASGKTSWSLQLSKDFSGEIISADSRQIYKKMTIGTAKVMGEWHWQGLRRVYMVDDIPHYLVDFLDPGKTFTVAEFRDKAVKFTKLAHANKRIPFLVGGTGLYIQSLVDNFIIPKVTPNKKLRKSLEEKTAKELVALLQNMDPVSANQIDTKNKRRLIRALEVCIFTGEPFSAQQQKGEPLFDVLQIGVSVPKEQLHDRIDMRVEEMIKSGLVEEIKSLLKQKYSWDLPSMNGIGYKEFRKFMEGEENLEEAADRLKKSTRQLAKKQMTWFRRDSRIQWVEKYDDAKKLVEKFLQS